MALNTKNAVSNDINDIDLCYNKYSILELEKNINNLELRIVLATQKLTPEFCIKYILNDNYASSTEDEYLCDYDVLKHQKHITQTDLNVAKIKLNKNNL